jgi:hypothetical protein
MLLLLTEEKMMSAKNIYKHSLRLLVAMGSCLWLGYPAIAQTNNNPNTVDTAPSDTPLLAPPIEQLQPPGATILPLNGQVNVTLINRTGAAITFQVLGETSPRSLPGRSETTLLSLKTPINLTFHRQDDGLLQVSPLATASPGKLEVVFRETTDLSIDKRAMNVQETGNVYLN